MNNSLHRLIDGMVATLRQEIIPQIGSEFARGQAFGLIYMLNSIRLRADWSPEFLGQQVAAQLELSVALDALIDGLDAPALPQPAAAGLSGRTLEALRDDNEGRICALIEWLEDKRGVVPADRALSIEAVLRQYMDSQLKRELETSAKPMFAEMSSGSE